jgi:hypothetical protein
VQEYVARVRGFGTGRPHIMMYEDSAGLGWPHPYEAVTATLFAQVDEIIGSGNDAPARKAFLAVLMQVAYKLGCREVDPLTWLPTHLEEHLSQDCLVEAWLLAKVRTKVEAGRTEGVMEEGWDERWRTNGRGRKIWEDGRSVGHIAMQLVSAGLVQWGDYTDGGDWMGWERARGKHDLGVQCKIRYEATLAEIRGHEGVRKWMEGWVEAQTEDGEWEGTIRRVTGARKVPQCM